MHTAKDTQIVILIANITVYPVYLLYSTLYNKIVFKKMW